MRGSLRKLSLCVEMYRYIKSDEIIKKDLLLGNSELRLALTSLPVGVVEDIQVLRNV